MEPTPTKDIAVAVMGGSAAIASILLVFVGFVIMQTQALPSETPNDTIKRYLLSAKLGLIPLTEQVGVILVSYLWLFYPTSNALFFAWHIGFVVGLILFIGYAALITLKLKP